MTESTIDALLGESYGLGVALIAAIAGFAGALVGLFMLDYLSKTANKVVSRLRGRR